MDALTVFAPGSMTPVRDALTEGFQRTAPDVGVRFHPPTYSGLLAEQIRQGAPADVFISANMDYLEALQRDGHIPNPRPLARNQLCLIARPELAPLRGVDDLGREGLRLVIPPAENDPLGQYTAMLFERAGLSQNIEEKRQRGEVRQELASLRGWLAAGEVDAAVIYATTVSMFGDDIDVIALPERFDMRDRIVFGVGVVVREGRRHPAAESFIEFLFSDAGQRILIDAKFLPLRG